MKCALIHANVLQYKQVTHMYCTAGFVKIYHKTTHRTYRHMSVIYLTHLLCWSVVSLHTHIQ